MQAVECLDDVVTWLEERLDPQENRLGLVVCENISEIRRVRDMIYDRLEEPSRAEWRVIPYTILVDTNRILFVTLEEYSNGRGHKVRGYRFDWTIRL